MAEKTTTLTIPDLCARLGQAERFTYIYDDDLKCLRGNYPDCLQTFTVMLAIGDKIPIDECEMCEQSKAMHDDWNCCACPKFKPRLAIVKGIKLVERCECGHEGSRETEKEIKELGIVKTHYTDTVKDSEVVCYLCGCKQYKPVQMVEITYKED